MVSQTSRRRIWVVAKNALLTRIDSGEWPTRAAQGPGPDRPEC
jgi:hypothetical protein